MNETKTYKVVEKPHPSFPKDVGEIFTSSNDVFEWIGDDKTVRQQRLSNNFCFKEVDNEKKHLEQEFEITIKFKCVEESEKEAYSYWIDLIKRIQANIDYLDKPTLRIEKL